MTSMTQEQFQDALNARVSTIEKVLVSALPKNITMQKTIADAMEYSLMAGGGWQASQTDAHVRSLSVVWRQ